MNKIKLIVILLVGFSSCCAQSFVEDFTPKLKIEYENINKEDSKLDLIIKVKYPQIINENKDFKASTDSLNKIIKNKVNKFIAGIEKDAKRGKGMGFALFLSTKNVFMKRNFISIQLNCNQDGVGPRSLSWTNTINYDIQTAKEIKFEDIIDSKSHSIALIEKVNSKLKKDCKINTERVSRLWNLTVNDQNIIFPLSDSQVDRICELPTVELNYSEIKDFIKKNELTSRLFIQ